MNLASDHQPLPDAAATRRYFAKFERIIARLRDVTATMPASEGPLAQVQIDIIETYLGTLANTFTALWYKHLMAHSVSNALPQRLEIDRRDSGFPVYRELLQMANDLAQVDRHLDSTPDRATLVDEMVDHILTERTPPRRLQFATSQRIYYELLRDRPVFLAQNHPVSIRLERSGSDREGKRSRKRKRGCYLIHWAVYDSQENLPTIYLMVVEDSSSSPLLNDERRWPAAQSHLLAQSMSSLKLVTIATGFDKDFHDLHPKLLRRIHVGPMYSHSFTEQYGPLREVLAVAAGEPGLDWAMAWTTETLVSAWAETRWGPIYGSVHREIYDLEYHLGAAAEAGASRVDRSLILPHRPYQILTDRDPPGLRGVRKFVVGAQGEILTGL